MSNMKKKINMSSYSHVLAPERMTITLDMKHLTKGLLTTETSLFLSICLSCTIHEITSGYIMVRLIISLVENNNKRTSLVLWSKVSESCKCVTSSWICWLTFCFGCPHGSNRATTPSSESSDTQRYKISFLWWKQTLCWYEIHCIEGHGFTQCTF